MGETNGFTAAELPVKEEPYNSALPPPRVRSKTRKRLFWAARYFFIVISVFVALCIPLVIFSGSTTAENEEEIERKEYRYYIYYIFLWLEISWVAGFLCDLFMLALPYIFRFVARYVNPAHQRYWRMLRPLRGPFRLLGTVIVCYASFDTFILANPLLPINYGRDADSWHWDDVIDDILQQVTFAVAFYVVEKIIVLYVTIHYHYRADQTRIEHSKEMHKALTLLYDASLYSYPVGSPQFKIEDTLIRNSRSNILKKANGQEAANFLGRVGYDESQKAAYFGDEPNNSHWLAPGSSYTVVERALKDEKSAAALGTRIWKSLVPEGEDKLRSSDITEVLGPYRLEEAKTVFATIDENESKDITLEEMVWTVLEAGRIRDDIYQGMLNMNHCLNTFEWILILVLTVVMVFFVLVQYVPSIKQIQQTLSFLAIGLSFSAGRTINRFLAGSIFIFFDHPFDVGDRVQVYNMGSSIAVSCIVKHQSILYTIFTRIDNRQTLQISNERLYQKRIENVTRSGGNKEGRTLQVHVNTSFVEIMALRSELEAFAKANPRDYLPALSLNVVDMPDLNYLQLKVSWTHKHNWSNEQLRSKRSSRMMCAIVAAVRKVGLLKPGVEGGSEANPIFNVNIGEPGVKEAMDKIRTDGNEGEEDAEAIRRKEEKAWKEDEAREKLTKLPATEKKVTTTSVDLNGLFHPGVLGMRHKGGSGSGLGYHGPA